MSILVSTSVNALSNWLDGFVSRLLAIMIAPAIDRSILSQSMAMEEFQVQGIHFRGNVIV